LKVYYVMLKVLKKKIDKMFSTNEKDFPPLSAHAPAPTPVVAAAPGPAPVVAAAPGPAPVVAAAPGPASAPAPVVAAAPAPTCPKCSLPINKGQPIDNIPSSPSRHLVEGGMVEGGTFYSWEEVDARLNVKVAVPRHMTEGGMVEGGTFYSREEVDATNFVWELY
jgi:hypothetical protein